MNLPLHFTEEYAKLGITVKENTGLSEPVVVCITTGTMHRCGIETPLACCDILATGNHGVLHSLSRLPLRACVHCSRLAVRAAE